MRKLVLRTCVGCRVVKPKKEFIRLVANANGEVEIDPTGKRPGKGAYICNKVCLNEAFKKNNLSRAFKRKVRFKELL